MKSARKIHGRKTADAPSPDEINSLVTFFKQRRFAEGEVLAKRLTVRYPRDGFAWKALGVLLKEQGKIALALEPTKKAAQLMPQDAQVHNNLGNILKDLGRFNDAEASYLRALKLMPGLAEAHSNLGNTLKKLGRFAEAEASYLRALELKPDVAQAHNNLGNMLQEAGKLSEAAARYHRALELQPDFAEAHNNLGNVFKDLGRLDEAEARYLRALELKPDFAEAHSNLLFALNYAPHHPVSYSLEEARRYGRMVAGKAGKRFTAWQCIPRPERLRVGFVSGDLYSHPVGYFLENVLSQIDPSRFELIAYATDNKEDELTIRIKQYFAAWEPLVGRSDETAARLIHADGVHVLMDLAGHTAKNRLPVFAWKPAPLQVSWLGYFATTGVAEIDYLLGDPYVTPLEEAGHFTETIWRLPESRFCFTPPDINLDVGPLPAISAGAITFGCFNNLAKINDAVVNLWAKVLLAVPLSRLYLKARQLNDPGVFHTMRQRFASCGISPDRLLLEGHSPREAMLAAYNRVDINLDPFPYTGGTTSAEGLWMGVPVLTLRGDRLLSHQGEGIVHNAGLDNWIAESDGDYVAKAVMHTANPEHLAALRSQLRRQVLNSPLFDAPRFARHFEKALWDMWECCRNRQGIKGPETL